MKKKRGVLIFVFFGIVLMSFYCSAYMALSPPSYEVTFEPGVRKDFVFNVYGEEGQNLYVSLKGDKELLKYASVNNEKIEGSGSFIVSIRFPRSFETPGPHSFYVALDEKKDAGEGVVGVAAALRGKISVFVPYPGKYAETQFKVENTKSGEEAPYELKVSSMGDERISVVPRIVIYDAKNKSKDSFFLETRTIESTMSETYKGKLNVANYPAGLYHAIAFVDFGGRKPSEATAYFRIGELFVDIVNYTKYVIRDKISRFDIEVESQWNDPLENVYAEVSVPEYNINFRTPSINLEGFQRAKLSSYFDTRGIEASSFKANIKVYYANKISEKNVIIRFKGEVNYLMIGLITGIAVMILIIAGLIWHIKKLSSHKVYKRKKR